MDPTVIAQKLAFGLFVGSNYGVVAVGLTLIFGVMRVLNVAHGELLMLGGYASYVGFTLAGIDPYISVALSAVFSDGPQVRPPSVDVFILIKLPEPFSSHCV